jgi:hypothetical protein
MVKGSVWNSVDLIPDLDNAPAGKRGGTAYQSNDISATKATASYVIAGIYAQFSGGVKNCCLDEDGELYTIASAGTVTDIGAALASLQNPVFHSNKIIIPGNDGTTAPKYYDGTTLGNLAGSPPAGKYAAVYRDRTVLGPTSANLTKTYFSGAADPTSWDTTNSWESTLTPPTGYAALANALLIFQKEKTSRIRGSSPDPGGDFFLDDPFFNVGCTDARSIAVTDAYCVFANPLGIYLSTGFGKPEDLTETIGLKRYWNTQLASYDASTYTLGAGMIQGHYIISVMNGSTFVDALMIDIDGRRGWRLSNFKAVSFWPAVTIGEELYAGSRSQPRVLKTSTIFTPSSTVKNDADGTAVPYTLETPFYEDGPWLKRFGRAFFTHDTRDAASDNPTLAVSYIVNPEDAYTSLGTLSESTNKKRQRLAVNKRGSGIAFRVVQSNASSNSRFYAFEAEVAPLERSGLAQ